MTDSTIAAPACPICGRPAVHEVRPFCSRRCADLDLGRWFTGQYAVPGPSMDEMEQGKETQGSEPT